MMHIKQFTMGPVAENTFVLYNDIGDAAIIDCGCSEEREYRLVLDFISTHHLSPVFLLNTHMHFDHAWGNAWATTQWPDIVCHAPHKDIDGMPSVEQQLKSFMPMEVKGLDLPKSRYKNIKQDDEIILGSTPIKILEVPGHSPGHVAFYIQEANMVLTGDALFCEGIGRTDLWGGNYNQLINSIKTQLLILPEDTYVYCGHGPSTTIRHEKRNNPFLT